MTFSAKRLSAYFGDSTGVWGAFIRRALQDHEAGKAWPQQTLQNVDSIIDGHGVETLWEPYSDGSENKTRPPLAYYVNTGDTYSATLLWDCRKRRWVLSSWGDFYERTPEYRRYCKS